MGASYSRGPESSLTTKTTHQILADTVSQFGDREALVVSHSNIRHTWRELADEVERTARGLIGLGLQPGDRVGMWATNCAEWVYLQLGCARAGLVLVNVNPAYRSHELAYVLKKSGMKALVLRASDARSNYKAILEEALQEQEVPLRHSIYLGEESWDRMIAGGVDAGPGPTDCHDVVNIQYTSGTTGSPKGVLLTHSNLLNNAQCATEGVHATEQDRVCVPVPLYHCFGCVIGSLGCLRTGATMILPSPTFDPMATMQAIQNERVTVVYGVPTMFIAMLQHPEFSRFDFLSLRSGIMAGAPCPIEVMKRIVSDMHCAEMTIAYGQTEASPLITIADCRGSFETRVATIGSAGANIEVKIVDPSGETLPIGEQGELCGRGYMVMKGYDNDSEATARAVDKEGWLHTGDLAAMRPDGYFRITGRLKDMIIRGGENIYPREVEEFLYTHPKISDVQVVGLPDEKFGETVGVWIRLKTGQSCTEDEIREFCRGKIAHFKIPQYIRFVESFPMTVTGKIQKFRIREIEIQERHLEKAAGVQTA